MPRSACRPDREAQWHSLAFAFLRKAALRFTLSQFRVAGFRYRKASTTRYRHDGRPGRPDPCVQRDTRVTRHLPVSGYVGIWGVLGGVAGSELDRISDAISGDFG